MCSDRRQLALDTYSIDHWGGGYFDINQSGHLIARPDRDLKSPGIDLYQLAEHLRQIDLTLPVLVRFKDILADRVTTLNASFERAIGSTHYRGSYQCVYPIKVNQQRYVVEQLVSNTDSPVGLEAGSKPELMAILALTDTRGGVVVCNGYKDSEYIRLALAGRRLGMRLYIVIEKLSELDLIIREAQQMGIEPLLGIRVRLASIAGGNWQNSGGMKAKFGLNAQQVVRAVERLSEAGMVESLGMIHFHMGSQISNLQDIRQGMQECARYYAELRALGVPIETINTGGGLGVDYDGTRSRGLCSMNYGVDDYAEAIVTALERVCSEQGLPHPEIFTESGRALTAHHAMLITGVIDRESTTDGPFELLPPAVGGEAALQHLWAIWQTLEQVGSERQRSRVEIYHDAQQRAEEIQQGYMEGRVTLKERAVAEQLFSAICHQIRSQLNPSRRNERALIDELNERLAGKYFCNFSLFQSLPDVWGIGQIFPVVPLHRLDEEPTERVVLEDITCDSDGRIDRFVENEGIEGSLQVHPIRADEPYLLGIFMVGAYQEILGDMHNLFGDTHSINVELLANGDYRCYQPQRGDTVDTVLRYVNFEPQELKDAYRNKVAAAELTDTERESLLELLYGGIEGYTYLEE